MVNRIGLSVVCLVLVAVQIVFAESFRPRWNISQTEIEVTRQGSKRKSTNDRGQLSRFSFTPKPGVLTSTDPRKLNELDKAYLDAFTILRENNACSRLYGGPPAIEALNELVRQLRPTYLDQNIAIRMSGTTTVFQNNRNGFYFRMFQKAEINLGGPFYRGNSPWGRKIPLVGKFQPNTRETRIVVLLHELGHLVRTEDDRWVLSDDGEDTNLSVKNTEYVVGVCRKELESIGKMTATEQLEETLSAVDQVAKVP